MSKIVIKNIDKMVGDVNIDKKPLSKNPLLWQNSTRWIVTGSSGSGKTSMVLQIILNEFKFDKLYICSKTIEHPKYQYIKKTYDDYYYDEIKKALKKEYIH